MTDAPTPFDREREGYQRQAFAFYRLAQEAATEEIHDLWRAAESQMEIASLANAPEIAAHHVASAAHFARHAQYAEQNLSNPASPPETPEDTTLREERRKAARAVIKEKADRTRLANLKKKFGDD
jgi:hypothetical protein